MLRREAVASNITYRVVVLGLDLTREFSIMSIVPNTVEKTVPMPRTSADGYLSAISIAHIPVPVPRSRIFSG